MDVSIIIVNYNTKELLFNCISSIYKYSKEINFEIIVSDNGSSDGSQSMIQKKFPTVKLIENRKNIGFGAANNKGLKIASGKYVFFLNSDTILLNNAIKYFFDYWEASSDKDSLGALGTNLKNEDGQIIHSYGCFPDRIDEEILSVKDAIAVSYKIFVKKLLFKYKPKINQIDKQLSIYFIGEVDDIVGADLFMKNNKDAVFDENYFLYYEETDLQLQLAKKRKSRQIIEGPEIIHKIGGSQLSMVDEIQSLITFSNLQYSLSRIYYYKKNKNCPKKVKKLKLLTFILWCNPLLFSKTRKYIKTLMEI